MCSHFEVWFADLRRSVMGLGYPLKFQEFSDPPKSLDFSSKCSLSQRIWATRLCQISISSDISDG